MRGVTGHIARVPQPLASFVRKFVRTPNPPHPQFFGVPHHYFRGELPLPQAPASGNDHRRMQ